MSKKNKRLASDIAETKDTNQVAPDNGTALFWVDKDQLKKLNKFSIDHSHCQRGAIGGAVTYEFSPTSLGIVVRIRCHCGKSLDVTNYMDW